MLRILLVFGFAIFAAGSHQNAHRYAAENAYRRGLNRNADAAESYHTYRYPYNQNYNPGYNPPSYNPPSYNPPSYNPPSYNPPSYNPPSYNPPSYNPPNYSPNYNPGSYKPNYKPNHNYNGYDNFMNSESNLAKSNRLVNVVYLSYQSGAAPTLSKTPRIDPQKDTFVLVHGFTPDEQNYYVADYFEQLSKAILNHCQSNCNVIGFEWDVLYANQKDPLSVMNAALEAGKILTKEFDKIPTSKRMTLIGHNIGNAVIASTNFRTTENKHVFGIQQKTLPDGFQKYYLRRDMFPLVQTINIGPREKDLFQSTYGHRNFYYIMPPLLKRPPGSPQYRSAELNPNEHSDFCFDCDSYRLFALDIMGQSDGHPSAFCDDFKRFTEGGCKDFPIFLHFNSEPSNDHLHGRFYAGLPLTSN